MVSKLLLRWQLHFSKSFSVSAMSSLEACSARFCSSGERLWLGRSFGASSPSFGASSAGLSSFPSLTSASLGSFAASLAVDSLPSLVVSLVSASPFVVASLAKVTSTALVALPFLGLLLAFGDFEGGGATCGDNVLISSII
eukprot:Skav214876  [mRNA]  locus=scaffold1430:77294:77716:+ [translate_table: standard]